MFIERLLVAVIMTITVESMVILVYKNRTLKLFLSSMIINLFTNLSMNFLLMRYFFEPSIYPNALLILELLVVCIESFVYYLMTRNIKTSILLSLIANLLSFIIGIIFL